MTTTAERATRRTNCAARDSDWYEVNYDTLRPGDSIRFIHRGRLVEGVVERQGDGSLWCAFVTLTPARARAIGRISRRDLPQLRSNTMAFMDAIDSLDEDAVMRFAVCNTHNATEVFDLLLDSRLGGCDWYPLWQHCHRLVMARARQIGPRAIRYAGAAADTLCAAALVAEFEGTFKTDVRKTLAAGFQMAGAF